MAAILHMWSQVESEEMNITMIHDLDTGFLAATLKPAFEKLGHTCTNVQTVTTYLDGDAPHIDYLMSAMSNQEILDLKHVFKETDMFIIRSVTDLALKACGALPYITPDNSVYRVHGSELREKGVPYTLKTWRIDWYKKEPIVIAPRDHSLMPLLRGRVITDIERPCAFDTFPKRRRDKKRPFALTSPTNIEKKGTQYLLDNWKSPIPLQVIHGKPRSEVLDYKRKCSYYIDNIGEYAHGPYCMNAVEAWYYRVPVFQRIHHLDLALCPEVERLLHHSTYDTIQANVENHEHDKKELNFARKYALHTHDPIRIAKQYTKVIEQ